MPFKQPGRRFLIADDDFVSRRLMLRVLTPYAECDVAANGLEAVEAYRLALEEQSDYDIVFMDIMMPYMNGLDAVKTIREIEAEASVTKPLRVIYVSAVTSTEVVANALKHHPLDSYLVKPVTRGRLLEAIATMGIDINRSPSVGSN